MNWKMSCVLAWLLAWFLAGSVEAEETNANRRVLLFYGDSLTAGFGIDRDLAFPALIQARLDSLDWNYEAVNAGLSGETSAGGLRRIGWILRRKVDVFVLELGPNDGLRGIDLASTEKNCSMCATYWPHRKMDRRAGQLGAGRAR